MKPTRLLDVAAIAELVSRVGIPALFTEICAAMRTDFCRWETFDKSPRSASHSPTGVIELMPTSDGELYSFKYVNGHPGNPAVGLPTVMAFGALADVATGFPLLISEMTLLTAIRTAATSVVAAQCMARPNSRSMAVIGNGAQAEFQILAFFTQMGIREVSLFDIDPNATQKVIRNLQNVEGLRLIAAASAEEAVAQADIITTSTASKRRASVLPDAWLRPGVHVNAIGGDCPGKTELEANSLLRARVVVEYVPQSRIEGEIQQLESNFQPVELWQVLSDQVPGRSSDEEITIFDSVGFALEDFSTLRTVHRLAESFEIGTTVDFVPKLDDVKDLFSVLR